MGMGFVYTRRSISMMRAGTILATTFGCAALISSVALAVERPSLAKVAVAPKAYVGKAIGFRGASCVDDPKGGFVCRLRSGEHALRIDAGALGPAGGDVVAERLIGPCKGLDKLGSSECRFDVEIEPTSAQDEATMAEFERERVTRFYSGVINMRIAGRR